MTTRLIMMLAVPLALAVTPGAARPAVSPLTGVWRNSRDTIHLRVAECGQSLCGTVISASATVQADARKGSGKSIIGMNLFRNMRPAGRGLWKGKLYVPDIDANFSGRLVMTDPQSLTVSGCLFLGFVCKTQHWKRVE